MAMMIREYLDYKVYSTETSKKRGESLRESLFAPDPIVAESIMVDIEGIHVGATKNFTRYRESALKSSLKSWTYPYEKPLIMHHNEEDGKTIGRIKSVLYNESGTRSGTGALVFTTNIPDKDGKDQVKDGRLSTVSIGATSNDVRCSICGHNVAEYGPCEHERGQEYPEGICYWDIYEMEGKELSYVIVPSDPYAKNIKIYDAKEYMQKNGFGLTEARSKKGVQKKKMTDEELKELKEALQDLRNQNKELKEANEDLAIQFGEIKKERGQEEAEEENKEEKKEEKKAAGDEEKAGELEKALQDLEDAKKRIEDVKKELDETKSALELEEGVRQAAESKIVVLTKENKELLSESYNLLREATGRKAIETAQLKERTSESINDAILDLKEELKPAKVDLKGKAVEVVDPTLQESVDENVKKDSSARNIDLEEGLEDLFLGLTQSLKK